MNISFTAIQHLQSAYLSRNKQNNWQKQKEKPLKCNSLRLLTPGKLIMKAGSIRLQSSQSIETNQKEKLKIIYQNAQYLRNKIELFTAFLQSTAPDILAISEHGLRV
jgi:hypothetical protein